MFKKVTGYFLILIVLMAITKLTSDKRDLFNNDEHAVIKEKEITNNNVEAVNNWSQKKQKVKGIIPKDSPDKFAEWHNGIRTREGAAGHDHPLNYKVKEFLKARGLKSTGDIPLLKRGNTLNWIERGPGNVAGRTRSILVDPRDSGYNTWIVGSVGGGVWKTTTAGQTWTNLTEDLPNPATSTLAWSISNPDIIYAGTGEGFFNVDEVDGTGIWKSTNGGQSWLQIASVAANPDFENVMRLAVDPDNPDIVVAAVAPGFNHFPGKAPTSGIYRSINGGTTWSKTYDAGAGFIEDLKANPLNFNTQFATINGRSVIKSVDGGVTWFESYSVPENVARIELAIAPSDTSRIYLSAEDSDKGSVLSSSTDAGATWIEHSDAEGNEVNWLGGQGWYNNTLAVNPYDANEVFVGGVNLFRLNVSPNTDSSEPAVLGVDEEFTQSFWRFVPGADGSFANGGGYLGSDFFEEIVASEDDYVSIEIQFGPGKAQKAYRYFRDNQGQYLYRDYIGVPFEVWDVEHNRQLMASFRDHEDNGAFELEDRNIDETGGVDREYIFVNAVPYDENTDPQMTQSDGAKYKNIFVLWGEAPPGAGVVAPGTLNFNAVIRINWGVLLKRYHTTTNITDGYGNYGGSSKGVHVDHHNITLIKTNDATQSFRLINGNDGGISFSDDKGVSFSQTGEFGRGAKPNAVLLGYNTSQFYGIDKMNSADRYVGGTQDNGSWISPQSPDAKSKWVSTPGGDGFEAVWNYANPDLILESSQYNGIYRSTNRGQSWTLISGLIDNGFGSAPFFTKIAKSKQDPNLIFVLGARGVWRSDDFGTSWSLTSMPNSYNGTSSWAQLKISLSNPQIVWQAQKMTAENPPFVSTDGGLTFNPTTVYTEVTLGRVSGLATHPTEDSTAYLLLSFHGAPKILKTSDLGQTWKDISGFGTKSTSSGGFPDVAVFSLLVMPFDTAKIWAGTEIGIFESHDSGGSWAFADNGLPAVSVFEMLIVNDEIVVATHGRGVWSVALPELEGYEPPEVTLAPRFTNVNSASGRIFTEIRLPSAYDSTLILIDGRRMNKLTANTAKADTIFETIVIVDAPDTIEVALASYKNGRAFKSAPVPVIVFPSLLETRSYYTTDFSDVTNELSLQGLTIDNLNGFSDAAIHTPHPYPDQAQLIMRLNFPIIMASQAVNATLTYDDIALVEKGDPGTVFGDERFWDYVVVEGSKDYGLNWAPLAPGYDARANPAWSNAYDAGTPGNSGMFVSHSINLLDTFNAGDSILIRFRLYADAAVNGWGWAIDNLVIQGNLVSVEADAQAPREFSLLQNYPNPFNPSTQISYTLSEDSKVILQVFNVTGQKVREIIKDQMKKAGSYTETWDGKDDVGQQVASGLYIYQIKTADFVKSLKMILLR